MALLRDLIALVGLALALTAAVACQEPHEVASPGRPGASSTADRASLGPQPTPALALGAYLRALELGVRDPDLGLYTPESRRQLAGDSVTAQQQRNELVQLRSAFESMRVRRQGDLAVIRFGRKHRAVPPYFFRRGEEGWMLDLATMARVLVFTQGNEWSLRARDHEFAFAFDEE